MMIDIQSISITLAALSFLVAASYYIMTLSYTRKNQQQQLETRQAQLFMQLYQQFSSKDFVNQMNSIRFRWDTPADFNFIEWIRSPEDSDSVDSFFSTMYFFEGMGVLVKKGLVSPELVDDLMSAQTISIFETMLPIINTVRETLGPTAGEWYEYLYNEVKTIRDKEHPELAT